MIPDIFRGRLALPVVAAPMFLLSGPGLVLSCCKNGIMGTFPALNQRTTEGYEAWLEEIKEDFTGGSCIEPGAIWSESYRASDQSEASGRLEDYGET